MKHGFLRLGMALLLLPHGVCAESLRMVIVGDSTVSKYSPTELRGGWGDHIQDYFKSEIEVLNRARAGRSTKSFLHENLWAAALKEKPDLVLIQFGHNDALGSSHPEATEAEGEFSKNLRFMVDTARRAGATPILVTPMCRRNFRPDGSLKDSLLPYAEAMKKVAFSKRVALIDLHATSAMLFTKLGQKRCLELGAEETDDIHFNKLGAAGMAALVMRDLLKVEPRLASELSTQPNPPGR